MEIIFTLILLIGMGYNSYRFEQRKIDYQKSREVYESAKDVNSGSNETLKEKPKTEVTINGKNISVKILKKEKYFSNSSNLYQNGKLTKNMNHKT
ncbi:MAG: hypothetical protein K1X86_15375 [Ignavibacteria bacterium]|nr:hypothetical protein [Ignavibacteria bacterium]